MFDSKGILGCILGLIIFLVVFSLFEIRDINFSYIKTLWHNLKFISSAIYTLLPLLILVVFLYLLLTNKWAFRVERLSIGGFSILFDNPNHLFIRQVRTFLDTKRTIFKIDFAHDNFKETFDSFFEIYRFFRDEIKILGNAKKKKRKTNNETVELYNLANETIKVLNNFLTEHQSNYRRWYIYIEKKHEEDFYLKPIGELQKNYSNYEKLCNDFMFINDFFVHKIAKRFEIDIEKWGIKYA